VARPPAGKPLLVYDGDCGFCRRWVARWRRSTQGRVDFAPFQEAAERFPEIPPQAFARAVQYIETDGTVTPGAAGVFKALAAAPGRPWGLLLYRRLPGFARASEWFYRRVAGNRPFFSFLTAALWGKSAEPSTYFVSRRLFIACLGAAYFFAFVSLGTQLEGLVGSRGILPAADFLSAVKERFGARAYVLAPTLAWLGAGDALLAGLCAAGAVLALLLMAGVAPAPILLLLWADYLSLATVGRDFMAFQWDNLLLEAGFLAIFLAPWKISRGAWREDPPPPSAIWLFRWLLFRLKFSSGLVKLASGDAAWRSLTALQFHYETQPLPTWIGWYAHQLPGGLQRFSAGALFVVELAVPFLVFGPRRVRHAAGFVLAGLQAVILLTGNYCFFNFLSIALCLLLFEDVFWRRGRPRGAFHPTPAYKKPFLAAAAFAILVLSGLQMAGRFLGRGALADGAVKILAWADPFRTVNAYGLFAVMTTARDEIIVEGSDDGKEWRPYEFKWKPGDPARRPAFVAPHQPRLDWQMWFAALGTVRQNPWFLNFLARVLEGSPPVLELLAENPFPDKPPRHLRARLFRYRFAAPEERRADGVWWRREEKGVYCPPVSLRSGS
jgi:lipase maturation factor 1